MSRKLGNLVVKQKWVVMSGAGAVLVSFAAWAATEGASNTYFGTGAGISGAGSANALFGVNAGSNLTGPGIQNAMFGSGAGTAVTSGSQNSIFGANAGSAGNSVQASLFGFEAGKVNSGAANAFFGAYSGSANTTGGSNSFFGSNAGGSNVTGGGNVFVGADAGAGNTTGIGNVFLGIYAGYVNSEGGGNVYIGNSAGSQATTAVENVFVGTSAGNLDNTGNANSYVGWQAGVSAKGSNNAFFGRSAGHDLSTGNNNTILGTFANGQAGLTNATALGYQAQASVNNSLVLGSVPLVNEFGGANNYVAVGMGTDEPGFPLHIKRTDTTENMLRIEQASDTLKDRALMLLSNKGGTRFEFQNAATGKAWRFQAMTGAQNNFEITDVDAGTGVIELRLTEVGNLIISGTLTQNSNVHDKTGIVAVDGDALLDKVQKLPISEWRYKNDAETPHVGPMAQDFYAAFKLGSDETKIAPGDMAGIALAAIKAQQSEIEMLKAALAARDADVKALREETRALALAVQVRARAEPGAHASQVQASAR